MAKKEVLKTEVVKLSDIKKNPNNPRIIKDDKFEKLVNSIKEFPEMLQLRPIIVNDEMVVLGGNMRLKACTEVGLKEIPIIKASNLTEKQQREFIIKDNIGFGVWDWEMIANEWDSDDLNNWGLDVASFEDINLDDFFEESNSDENDENLESNKIILEYTKDDYDLVTEAFKNHEGTKEDIVFKLLGL